MKINLRVKHMELAREELAALLWDGLNIAASTCDVWADGIICWVLRGQSDMLSPMPLSEIRHDVRVALTHNGRRSVRDGAQSEGWNEYTQKWCMEQINRAFSA